VGLDLFHLLREAHKVSQRLERKAYRAISVAEKARRADAEAHTPKRRRGRPLTLPLPREQAETAERVAIETHDLFVRTGLLRKHSGWWMKSGPLLNLSPLLAD
jgi:hypothetical protein